MLDHVFTDAITVVRESLEEALLERLAVEEEFQVDILLGDCSWHTAYALPGEASPARVRADVTLDWPTWSQSAYRSWFIGEPDGESPALDVQVVFRLGSLPEAPELARIMGATPAEGPPRSGLTLERRSPAGHIAYDPDLRELERAVEITYEGIFVFDDDSLADGTALDDAFTEFGSWIAATLVRLGDVHPVPD